MKLEGSSEMTKKAKPTSSWQAVWAERPTYEHLKGRTDDETYQRALVELDRRYAWKPETKRPS